MTAAFRQRSQVAIESALVHPPMSFTSASTTDRRQRRARQ
jgi:hypothetical protein